jgi:hypothetical protein
VGDVIPNYKKSILSRISCTCCAMITWGCGDWRRVATTRFSAVATAQEWMSFTSWCVEFSTRQASHYDSLTLCSLIATQQQPFQRPPVSQLQPLGTFAFQLDDADGESVTLKRRRVGECAPCGQGDGVLYLPDPVGNWQASPCTERVAL